MRAFRLIVVYSASLLLLSCQGQAQGVKPQKLNPGGFEAKLNSTANEILVDVRTQEEYAEGHLSNAILIDIWSDDFKSQISKLDKSKPVFVYCKGGSRSAKAADAFVQLGFKQVYDLDGGISAWMDAEKKIVK